MRSTLRETFSDHAPRMDVYWEGEHGLMDHDSKLRILSLSSASLDRKLSGFKMSHPQRSRHGSLQGLKSSIPIIDTTRIDTTRAITQCGELCADTVAHGGSSMRESFAWTLTVSDTLTQWTENRAAWNCLVPFSCGVCYHDLRKIDLGSG